MKGAGGSLGHLARSILFAPFQILQHRAAALADRRIKFILAHVDGIVPAAVALGAVGLLYFHAQGAGSVARSLDDMDCRDDEEIAQRTRMTHQQRVCGFGRGDYDLSLQACSDFFSGASFFQSLQNFIADGTKRGPILEFGLVIGTSWRADEICRIGERSQVYAFWPARHLG